MFIILPLTARPPPGIPTKNPTMCQASPEDHSLHPAIATDAQVAEAKSSRLLTTKEIIMLGIQDAVSDALTRSQGFLDENAAQLTRVDFTAARKRLDEVAADLSSHALDQHVGSRTAKGETAKQQQLRVKLRREQMVPVALIARKNLRSVPEYASLQMPKAALRGEAFLASASGMADAATIHKDTLIAHGLPSTFLDDFKGGVANLAVSLSNREKNRSQRVRATKALSVAETNGRTVLGVLDALVQEPAGDNAALLRQWKSARLIRRRPGARATATAPATTPSTTPSTAPAPAGVTATAPAPLPAGEGSPTAAAA